MRPEDLELLRWFAALTAFGLGLNVGSFLNVVAHRVPLDLSVVRPRSRCPACFTPIGALDNVPVLSWILLAGRCRGCRGRISPRYAIVEILMGLLAVHIVAALVLWPDRVLDAAAWARSGVVFVAVAGMLAASLIDLDHRVLPDEITKPGMWSGPAVCAFLPEMVLGRDPQSLPWLPSAWPLPLQAAIVSAVGVAVGAGVLWSLGAIGSSVMGKDAMGFGDVKLLGAIGGFVGPAPTVLALVVAACVGSVAGIARRAVTGDRYIPFGPFLAIGGYVALLHGADVIDWYLDLARLR